MNCIILGDKYQKGMKSKGCSALIKSNKQSTIIDNQYYILSSLFDKLNITYVCGFDSKRLTEFVQEKAYNLDIVYNTEYEQYNDGYSLNLAAPKLEDETLILLGYQTLSNKIAKKINKLKDQSSVFISNDHCSSRVGCVIYNNNITTFNFGLENYIHDIYYLNQHSAKYLKNILSTNKYNNYFIFELLNNLIDSGLNIKPIVI